MLALSLMAQEGGGQVAQLARTFGVDWPHLTAQFISFALMCALLYWLAYKPVLKMLEERRRQIAQGIANTQKINDALANIESQRQDVLKEAQVQSTRLIAEARDVAVKLREQEAGRATAAAEQIVRMAQEAAAQEHARMLRDVRKEVAHLVVQTTASVIGKVLTPEDERRLASEAVTQLRPS